MMKKENARQPDQESELQQKSRKEADEVLIAQSEAKKVFAKMWMFSNEEISEIDNLREPTFYTDFKLFFKEVKLDFDAS